LKKILITGGDGFLARSIAEKLSDKYLIKRCNRALLDLNDSSAVFKFLKQGAFDVVIHTATYDAAPKDSLKDKNKVLESNLSMFFNLARCNDLYGKMLYFGSGAEFSREHWVSQMPESYFDKYIPKDQYGFSKYVMAKYAETTDNIFNLRLFGVFGEYDDWRYRFIPNICCHAVMNMPVKVHQNARVDFLYINDLVKIVKWFIEKEQKKQIYNVCSAKESEYSLIAQKVIDVSGKNLKRVINNPECSRQYSGNNSLLLDEMGGMAFTSMDEALKQLYAWYDVNQELIDVSQFHY